MTETRNKDFKPLINLVAKLSGAGLSFLMLIILARVMTPADFADFSVLLAWIAIGATIACMSMPLTLIRHIAEYLAIGNASAAKGMLIFAFYVSSFVSLVLILLGFAVYTFSDLPISTALEEAIAWIAALLFVSVLLMIITGYLQGLKRVIEAEILINLTRPLLLIVVIVIALQLNIKEIKIFDAVVYYTVVCTLILAVSFIYSIKKTPTDVLQVSANYVPMTWTKTALGFLLIAVVTIFYEKLDIILISILSTSEETAIYAVATKFSQTILMAMIAITAHAAPLFAEKMPELRANKTHNLDILLQSTTRNMVLVSLVAMIVFASGGTLFLRLFGEYYQDAYWPLVILTLGHFVSACFGPSLSLSTFVGETKIALFSLICGLSSNVVLSLLLTPSYKGIGAAIAMASALAISSITASILIKKKLNLHTFIRFG